MGELVPHQQGVSNIKNAVAFRKLGPEEEAAAAELRVKEANELEEKLKYINEKVPTRIYNTMSSSAGAGSGDFHQYRMVRRAEQLRQERMEADFRKKKEIEEYELSDELIILNKRRRSTIYVRRLLAEKEAQDRTAKRRAKRLKKKGKKKAKTSVDSGAAASGPSSGSDSDAPPQVALD